MIRRSLFVAAVAAMVVPAAASAQQLITNGGFESGLSGWTTGFQLGSSPAAGRYYASSSGFAPVSGEVTPGAFSGSGYALSDQSSPGAGYLLQSFTVTGPLSSATFSFEIFTNNWALATCDDSGTHALDYTAGCEQFGRVDLLRGTPSDPFSTSATDVITGQIDLTATTGNGYSLFSGDALPFLTAPGVYTLRFSEVDNQSFFNQGIDDVSLLVTPAGGVVPEPATFTLVGLGMTLLAGTARRRRAAH